MVRDREADVLRRQVPVPVVGPAASTRAHADPASSHHLSGSSSVVGWACHAAARRERLSCPSSQSFFNFARPVLMPCVEQAAARADETCNSPYRAKLIEGQKDHVHVWTLGAAGRGDGHDRRVTIDANPESKTCGRPAHTLLRGRISVLGFSYPYCRDRVGCPLAYRIVAATRDALMRDAALSTQSQLISLSCDPTHTAWRRWMGLRW